MRHRFISAAIAAAAIAILGGTADNSLANGFDYPGIRDLEACTAASNAVKTNNGKALDEIKPNIWPVNCKNCISHALQVMHPSVVGEFNKDGSSEAPASSFWTLRSLLTQIAGTRGPGAAIDDVLGSMLEPQTINTFDVRPRGDLDVFIVKPWIRDAGAVDYPDLIRRLNSKDAAEADKAWAAAPYKLVAIGYRPDLVRPKVDEGRFTSAGEGRFVFQAIDKREPTPEAPPTGRPKLSFSNTHYPVPDPTRSKTGPSDTMDSQS